MLFEVGLKKIPQIFIGGEDRHNVDPLLFLKSNQVLDLGTALLNYLRYDPAG